MPPVACILASVLHFRDDTLHVFRQVIGTVAYLGIGERAVIPQGLQGALADFQLQADILVVEPASRPLHAFQIQMGIPSTLCMNRSIFMANSSNAFLSKHTVSITIRFYVDTSNSYHPEKAAGEAIPDGMEKQPFIEFNIAEKRLHGNAGCNLINGAFQVDDENPSAISFPQVISTMMACPDMEVEGRVLKALNSVQSFGKLAGGGIGLYDADNNLVMVLVKN